MKIERVFAILFVLTFLLKLEKIPFASVFYVLTLTNLAIMYFFAGSYVFSHETFKKQKLPLSIVSGILFAIALLGIQFKMQFWPGATVMLTIGTIAALGIGAVSNFLRSSAAEELHTYYRRMILRATIIGTLCVLLLATPNSAIINHQYRNDPEYARLYIQALENTENKEYWRQYKEYDFKKMMGPKFKGKNPYAHPDSLRLHMDEPR